VSHLDNLWAGWRAHYLTSVTVDPSSLLPDEHGSLFERLLALPDEEALVVHRGKRCAAILNAYPYATGHLMVIPTRAVQDLGDLDEAEHAELWHLVRDAVAAVRTAYGCEGVNVGANLGRAGGAGVPDHLHVHVVPRWQGDTNFMTTVAGTRVIPEDLPTTWQRIRGAWPRPGS
jgi:diadenosine tetraphosphate (Ap4A) HIT family hydrolase